MTEIGLILLSQYEFQAYLAHIEKKGRWDIGQNKFGLMTKIGLILLSPYKFQAY